MAHAAPDIPHLHAKMKRGSSPILTSAPASMENMDHEGLPSALTTAFIIFDSI